MYDPEMVLTPTGYQKLMEELEYLRTVRRHDVAERLKASREVGEWDSPDQAAAREDQAFVEGRIAVLEKLLAQANVVEVARSAAWPSVGIGSAVLVRDETGEEEKYAIVGAMEADPVMGRISNQSPVAKALLGHQTGETVDVETPMGIRRLKILAISSQ
jgi:transcription elongation factor GreA